MPNGINISMDIHTQDKYKHFIKRINNIFKEGLYLSSDVVHFIDSTFSNPTIKEFELIICDEDNCDRDSLIELIFFPEESFQVKIEDLLGRYEFEKNDQQGILECFVNDRPNTKLYFPDDRGVLEIGIPRFAAEQFISRLNISKRLDKELVAILESETEASQDVNLIRVKMRNTRFEFSEGIVAFLSRFFKSLEFDSENFWPCFNFCLEFLSETESSRIRTDFDYFQALTNKKRQYHQQIQKAHKFEKYLQKNNIETLMLQGVTMPSIDVEDLISRISWIDRICISIFGRTEWCEPLDSSMNVGNCSDGRNMEKIVKLLS